MRKLLSVSATVFLIGCGDDGTDLDLANRDPRCVSACTDDPPAIDGADDVCSTASRGACLNECEARIAGTMTLCATCLTEDACFDPEGCEASGGDVVICQNNTCTVSGRSGSCTYPQGDEAAYADCKRQVDPRREVACTAEFRPVAECASSCS